MNRPATFSLSVIALLLPVSSLVLAQNAPPTYQADPDVYKVVFEDQNLRVIAATWKKGATDKSHSHPVPSVIYALTDCSLRVTAPDGTKRDLNSKAGSSMAVAITASHSAENVGAADCQAVFVERK
jgi:quercetin dioxygenase-like cupin family protein